MIKLRPASAPAELTDEVVQALTDEFKQTGKAVWQKEFIGKALLDSSHNKCCFSECKLNEEGKYDEVEHFHPKSLYPNEVVLWSNLLPINKACNTAKSDHDTKAEPIINPYLDDPKEHLYLKDYRFIGKTELGRKTIEVVNLNDWDMWVVPRFDIGKGLYELLEALCELANDYNAGLKNSSRSRNNLVSRLRGLMIEGTEKKVYSATVASLLLHEEMYFQIRGILQRHSLWDDSFISLEEQMQYCALDNRSSQPKP
ncbi:MAG: HNH endonuclease [Cytophagales bacterium]|nr:MAG: HNH endonuclease [Cytophagales bacterium]